MSAAPQPADDSASSGDWRSRLPGPLRKIPGWIWWCAVFGALFGILVAFGVQELRTFPRIWQEQTANIRFAAQGEGGQAYYLYRIDGPAKLDDDGEEEEPGQPGVGTIEQAASDLAAIAYYPASHPDADAAGRIFVELKESSTNRAGRTPVTVTVNERSVALVAVSGDLAGANAPVRFKSTTWSAPLDESALQTRGQPLGIQVLYENGELLVPDREIQIGREVGAAVDDALDWVETNVDFIFGSLKDAVDWLFIALQDALRWIPWPGLIIMIGVIAWRTAGSRTALAASLSLFLLALLGYWESTLDTIALVMITVTLSIAIAVPLGIWASQNDRLDRALRPFLDAAQTMPSFVYLVPMIGLFSIGTVPAVMATLVYAVPPAVRLTNLGIRQLPEETIEAAESFGLTQRQMLLKVKVPLAMPTIMAGVNQTTLMALAMIVIGSLVGAPGLGFDVLQALGRLEPGNALLAGLGIVMLAIIIDRVTQAIARKRQAAAAGVASD